MRSGSTVDAPPDLSAQQSFMIGRTTGHRRAVNLGKKRLTLALRMSLRDYGGRQAGARSAGERVPKRFCSSIRAKMGWKNSGFNQAYELGRDGDGVSRYRGNFGRMLFAFTR
jgi:hypothetical protein